MRALGAGAFLLMAIGLAGCANPLNRATSDRYAEDCSTAERAGNLAAAEELCYRALVNVDWGNLGTELKSQRLYNLARIKRRVSKFSEAEPLLQESLRLEEPLSGPSSDKVGRRLAELSVNLAAQEKWSEGLPLVERLLPLADGYAGGERAFVAELLRQYAGRAGPLGRPELVAAFEAKARALTPR